MLGTGTCAQPKQLWRVIGSTLSAYAGSNASDNTQSDIWSNACATYSSATDPGATDPNAHACANAQSNASATYSGAHAKLRCRQVF